MSEKRRYPASTAPTKSSGTVQMKRKSDSRRDVDLKALPNVQKVDQTNAGDVFHLTTGARVGLVILPRKLVQHICNDDVERLVGSYWIEHLIYDKLASPNLSPTVSHYYSERLLRERYDRAELEVKLYGDAIAKDGLPLSTTIESSNVFDLTNSSTDDESDSNSSD